MKASVQTPAKSQEQVLHDYDEKSDKILKQMYQILMRVQRSIDSAAYRKILEKLNT